MKMNYKIINAMSNLEIIKYLYTLDNKKDLQDALEYISLNLDSTIFQPTIDNDTFFFIYHLLSNKKIIQNRGLWEFIITLESSDLDFSQISKAKRFKLINKITSASELYESSVACEIGRFIIRYLLINKPERLKYILDIKKELDKKIAKCNYLDMLYFMILDYQDNSEINQSEKENITKLLKKISKS